MLKPPITPINPRRALMARMGNGMKPAPMPPQPDFSRQPLRWTIPPGRGQAGAIASPGPGVAPIGEADGMVNLSSISFSTRQTGVIGTAYPTLTRIALIGFAQPSIIVGVTLTSSIVNAAAAAVAVIVIHKDIGATMSVASGSDFFAEHIVEQGLSHSIRTGTSFTENIAPAFGTNEFMALYAVSGNAANAFTAIVSIRYLNKV